MTNVQGVTCLGCDAV